MAMIRRHQKITVDFCNHNYKSHSGCVSLKSELQAYPGVDKCLVRIKCKRLGTKPFASKERLGLLYKEIS